MKLLPLIAALAGATMTMTPAAAAPVIGDALTCTGTGLACSRSAATVGTGTEFTGNFGSTMPILAFDFSDGLLKISNASTYSYGVVADMNMKFRNLTTAFADATVVSNNGFYGLSQGNFAVANGVLQFSSTFFSAAQNATMTVRVGSPGAVPEPASWAMTILGLGMIGFALRRQTSRSQDGTGHVAT